MRHHGDSQQQFDFPDEHDMDMYLEDEIVKVLNPPQIMRHIRYFSEDLPASLRELQIRENPKHILPKNCIQLITSIARRPYVSFINPSYCNISVASDGT
jgi:hypothetical protein